MQKTYRSLIPWLAIPVFAWLVSNIQAATWFNSTFQFRRPIELIWDAERAGADEVATVDFYTAGHHKPNGEDIRVTSSDGTLLAHKVIMVGPGDRVRLLFNPVKNEKSYFVYFGSEKPEALPKKLLDWTPQRGLLFEMRQFDGKGANNPLDIERIFENARTVIGQTIIDRPFLGINPFGEQQTTISKITGSLFIPADGEYGFAGVADDITAFFLDDKPVTVFRNGPADIRQNVKLELKRGPHPFKFYHINYSGNGAFTLAWKRPDMSNFDVIPRDSFGFVPRGNAGALEIREKPLVADFSLQYVAESFVQDRYTHHYKFAVNLPKTNAPPKYEWDFGDGQTATGEKVDHVYLTEGVFPVRLTARIGPNADTQTTQIHVSRLYEKIANPPGEDQIVHARLIEKYDPSTLSPAAALNALWITLRSDQLDSAIKFAARVCAAKTHPNRDDAVNALRELTREALSAGKADAMLAAWEAAPAGSDLGNNVFRHQSQILLWWKADFDAAIKLLRGKDDPYSKRLLGEALILAGKADEGRKILIDMPSEESPEKQVAISGAMARTTEYFIRSNDAESGEEHWERWQQRYPSDFVEGYSMVLRVKLIELRKQNAVAAKLAEAFALAMPNSTYAPTLLNEASRLLEKVDSAKSQKLRELLKQKYPEDPLSNK